jgi:CBS-domain-containing membrane protein
MYRVPRRAGSQRCRSEVRRDLLGAVRRRHVERARRRLAEHAVRLEPVPRLERRHRTGERRVVAVTAARAREPCRGPPRASRRERAARSAAVSGGRAVDAATCCASASSR